jgi:predicted short-subunit dehydrogenase-like oxidoreductase (DUF2520 family)
VYLLDTDVSENQPWDRTLTDVLYGGDDRYRLCQEMVLGVGGFRLLRALGYEDIRRFHMNEGHAALLVLALGEEKREALKAILPLIKGTLQNIETLGIPDALTGPIMRGDAETVRNHLDAMQERTPELLVLYKALARQTITVAREKGSLTVETAEQLLTLVKS